MKKKLVFLIGCLTLMLCFCACSAKKTETTYGGYTEETLRLNAENTASSLIGLSDEALLQNLEYYGSMASDSEDASAALNYALLSDWSEVKPVVGEFQGFSDFTVDKTGKTLTTTLLIKFSNRDAKIIYVFNANNMKITAMNVEPVYSLSEIMSKAALNTVMGILTVFTILILISLVIFAFNVIPYLEKKFKEKDAPAVAQSAPATVSATEDVTDDLELVAVIAAAIAADTGTTTDSFVVRSIKRRY